MLAKIATSVVAALKPSLYLEFFRTLLFVVQILQEVVSQYYRSESVEVLSIALILATKEV